MSEKIKIAVLVSGGGTNLQALIDAEKSGIIKSGHIVRVISNKPGAYALERAAAAGIPSATVVSAGRIGANSRKSCSNALTGRARRSSFLRDLCACFRRSSSRIFRGG